jgi:hypothetical protein
LIRQIKKRTKTAKTAKTAKTQIVRWEETTLVVGWRH